MMNKYRVPAILLILFLTGLATLSGQSLKVAVTAEPGNRYSRFFRILSERSGVVLRPVPVLPGEMGGALRQGLVDLAILPESGDSDDWGQRRDAVWETPMILISESGFNINERNIISLRTVGVFPEDENLLESSVIDRYSLDIRMQRARHYDSLVRIMISGRVSAIYLPLNEFERSLSALGENRARFGAPFETGYRVEYLYLSSAGTGRAAPLMDRLSRALEAMKAEGIDF